MCEGGYDVNYTVYCGNGEGVVQYGEHKGDFSMLNINNS